MCLELQYAWKSGLGLSPPLLSQAAKNSEGQSTGNTMSIIVFKAGQKVAFLNWGIIPMHLPCFWFSPHAKSIMWSVTPFWVFDNTNKPTCVDAKEHMKKHVVIVNAVNYINVDILKEKSFDLAIVQAPKEDLLYDAVGIQWYIKEKT